MTAAQFRVMKGKQMTDGQAVKSQQQSSWGSRKSTAAVKKVHSTAVVVRSECLLHRYKLSVPRSNGLVKVSNVVFGFVTQRSFVISNGCVWTLAPP